MTKSINDYFQWLSYHMPAIIIYTIVALLLTMAGVFIISATLDFYDRSRRRFSDIRHDVKVFRDRDKYED